MKILHHALRTAALLLAPALAGAAPALIEGPYLQEVQVRHTEGNTLGTSAVRTLAATAGGALYAGGESGGAYFAAGTWHPIDGLSDWSCLTTVGETVYAVAGGMLYTLEGNTPTLLANTGTQEVHAMAGTDGALWLATDAGLVHYSDGALTPVAALNGQITGGVRDVATHGGEVAVATGAGVFLHRDGDWAMELPGNSAERWAPNDVRAVAYDSQGQLWFAAPQGVGVRGAEGVWNLYAGEDGLPFNDFTAMTAGTEGAMWFATTHGAVKYADGVWAYRESRRWLADNQVYAVATTPDGTAWFGTAGGISAIEARPMTLAEKAAFYEDEVDRHHKRTPFGYVVNAGLAAPGDKANTTPYVTDNDGQYTGLYAGAECLAYGATKDPHFKKRATEAFEALAFLSEVTQGGEHPAPKGFVARAIMPIDGPDPNEEDNPERDRKKREGDKLWKILEPRWPVSADGKWYWKTDTSSDELDGHFFAYGLYYDLVAETEEEKARAAEVAGRVMDHLLEHDYRLVDHDGTPTRWARFSPEDLNKNADYWTERGLNSLSLLTYLSVTHRITGDEKYREAYMTLVKDHDYALNGMVMPKLQYGPGSFVQFDDKMAFMNYYHLIQYETDPELLRMYYDSIYYYWNIEKYEMNAFFNIVYAACCLGKVRTDQWGDLDLTPEWPWLEHSVDTLKRYPLDLVDWPMTNDHRIDLLPLPDHVREPGKHIGKGYRVNGLVLPIDERQALSWSEDAWAFNTGGNGTRLRDGAPYLLAYYMGRYHGFIADSKY